MTFTDRPRSLLLFGGSNDRAIYAFARAARTCGVPFQVIAWGQEDRILRGGYADSVCAIRHGAELELSLLETWVEAARRRAPDDLLILVPSSEYLNTFLLNLAAADIARLGVEVPLPDRSLYAQLSDKESATRLFEGNGFRVPRRLDGYHERQLPMVAKPRRNMGCDGRTLYPRLLHTPGDLQAFQREAGARIDEYFPQEFVEGSSNYLLMYLAEDGRVYTSSQVNLAQQPNGKSIVLARTGDFHCGDVATASIELLRHSGFKGLAMIEFIIDDEGPCFIEVNPRPWGPLQLCLDHRCGIVEAFLGDVLHDDPDRFRATWARKPTKGRYAWTGGILQTMRSRGAIAWQRKSIGGRVADLLRCVTSDVYLRRDSWRVFIDEALKA